MSNFTPKGRVCHLKRWKTSTPYGFSLEGKFTLGYPVVKSVTSNSPAICCGILPKDLIIEINGEDTKNISFDRIKNVLKESTECTLFLVQLAELNFLKMYFPHLSSSCCPHVLLECPIEPRDSVTAKSLGISELECSLLRADGETLKFSHNRRMAAITAQVQGGLS